jgi:hypothetical protein
MLIADIKNCPEGAEVVFDIYDMSVKPPKKVDSAKGKHNKGLGKGEWVVADKENKGEELKLEFEATARSRTSVRVPIQLKLVPGLWFHIDLDNPLSYDDTIILRALDGSSETVLKMKDMKESMEDMVLLEFPEMKDGIKYDLIYDPGEDGEPVIFEHDVDKNHLLGL